MDYQELLNEVRKLEGQPMYPTTTYKGEDGKETKCEMFYWIKECPHIEHPDEEHVWDRRTLGQHNIVNVVRSNLLKNFEKVKKADDHYWHSFVREAFYSPDMIRFLNDDLLRLVQDYTESYIHEFIKKEEGTLLMPKRMLELNRLHILFNNFFKIYRNIIQNIHFENPIQQNYGKNINGKINWAKTIQLSKTEFPSLFFTQTWQKEFERPGNILLILCLRWLYDTANTILHVNFDEELTNIEIKFLVRVIKQTKNCLDNFPFPNVINYANKYANLRKNDKLILELEKHLQIELKQKIVRNPEYQKLLEWIEEFDTVDFSGMSEDSSNFALETIKNIDLAYENWIFWKLVESFDERFGIKHLEVDRYPEHFEFVNDGRSIFVAHGKIIPGYVNSQNTPDYSVFLDKIETKNLFCIFDSKHTDKIIRDQQQVILAYQQDLDCSFGGLISKADPKTFQHETEHKITWYISLKLGEEYKEDNKENLEKLLDQITAELMFL